MEFNSGFKVLIEKKDYLF